MRIARAKQNALHFSCDLRPVKHVSGDRLDSVGQLQYVTGTGEDVQREVFHRAAVVEKMIRRIDVGANMDTGTDPRDVIMSAFVHGLKFFELQVRVTGPGR